MLLIEKLKKIKLLILDVDGVMTDGKIYLTATGEEIKAFHAHDGHGIRELARLGITIAIITGRHSQAVITRAHELGIQYLYQGQADKTIAYEKILEKLNLQPEQVAYMGDDLPDLPLMQRSGFAATVPQAVQAVISAADWISNRHGGEGAVRECCDLILQAQLNKPTDA